jgi:AhpD family alkylhydroperoxidase
MEPAVQEEKELLANLLHESGWVSNPLKLMENRHGTVKTFMAHSAQIFKGGPLNKKEQALIALAVTAAIKSKHCIRTKAEEAKKAGISEEEIVQTLLITGLVVGNSLLHTAYEAINWPGHQD